MIETLKIVNKISASMRLNIIVYHIKKIPLLKKLFSNLTYKNVQLKKSISVISVIISVISIFFSSILTIGITLVLPMYIYYNSFGMKGLTNAFWHMIFLLFFLFSVIGNASILEPSKNKFIFIKLMRMDAKEYILSTFIWNTIWKILSCIPIYLLIGFILNIPFTLSILLVVSMYLFRPFGEMIFLFYYDKCGEFIKNHYIIYGTYLVLTVLLGYVPLFFQKPLSLTTPVIYGILIGCIILGVIGFYYMSTYKKYKVAINDANKLDKLSIDIAAISKKSKFADVELKTKQFSDDDLRENKFKDKKGYDYLNAIFFDRHKKIVKKPIYYELAIVGILLVVGIVCNFIGSKEFSDQFHRLIYQSFPGFIFILYVMSTAGRITKAMFYNCDISLLRYGFYKKENAVLATFRARLNKLALYNLIPAVAIAISLFILGILTGLSIRAVLPVAILVIALSLFFAVHHLFLYYILQPYTTELDIKNPFFGIINGATYLACYSCLKINVSSIWFLSIVLGATIIYIIVALILVYKFAPKTFVVK